jgi:hypothetical protein
MDKEQKRNKVHKVMDEYKHHNLHSGSKSGPKVHSRDQAIAMSESGQSKDHHMKNEHETHHSMDGHHNNAMFDGGVKHSREPHRFERPPATNAHGFGHAAHRRAGALRLSGHPKAHRIGKK